MKPCFIQTASRPRVVSGLLIACFLAASASADSTQGAIWIGPLTADTAGWNLATNWSPNTVPSDPSNIGASIGANSMNFSAVGATAEFLTVGGAGTLTFSGGTLQYNGDGLIGTTAFTNGPGVVNQTGGSIVQTGGGTGLLIGHNLSGQWSISGGTLQSNTPIYLGHTAGGTGQLSISGAGGVTANTTTFVGTGATGTVAQTGGTLTANSNFFLGNGSASTYTQSGGSFDLNASMVIGNAGAAAHAYNVSGSSIVDIQADLRVGLNVAGTLSLTGASATFSVGSNLTFDKVDSVFNVGITSPTTFSTVNVGGGIGTAVATGADLNVTINSVTDPLVNQVWTIINNTNVSGGMKTFPAFAPVGGSNGFNLGSSATLLSEGSTFNVTNSATLSTINLQISYIGGLDLKDMTLRVLQVTPVPEPSSIVVLGWGLAGLLSIARYKR